MSPYAWSDRPSAFKLQAAQRSLRPLPRGPWGRAILAVTLAGCCWALIGHPWLLGTCALLLVGVITSAWRTRRAQVRFHTERARSLTDYESVPWTAEQVAQWAATHAPAALATLEVARQSDVGLLRGDLVFAQLGRSMQDLAERQQRLDAQWAAAHPA